MEMHRETQGSIARWRYDTFGPIASMFSLIVRTKSEAHELLVEVDKCAPRCSDGVLDELADVAICLYCVATQAGGRFDESAEGLDALFRMEMNPINLVVDVDTNLSHALRRSAFVPRGSKGIMRDITFAMAALRLIASLYGKDLNALVDAKMAVNRKREWRPDGRGHGQHVDGGSE